MSDSRVETQVVVIGGGPGGYAAAFRAADLGLQVAMVDTRERPGGVCLNVGCIPSKALLHAAEVIDESRHAGNLGLKFKDPEIDLDRLREWKNEVVQQLTGGLGQLAKQRKVNYIQGRAEFSDEKTLKIQDSDVKEVRFEQAIIATGSRPSQIPGLNIESDRLLDSTSALDLPDIPKSMLVVGGGYIGLELGTVYSCLGSDVTVVEMLDGLLPGVDRDLVRPLEKRVKGMFKDIFLKTRVKKISETKKGLSVEFEGDVEKKQTFDRVLVSVGRKPNTENVGLENAGVSVNEDGFIDIDRQCRTSVSHIFAIGDVAGQPMLAHKAMREGKVAAEVIAGQKSEFDNRAVPAVVFTNPEVAWTGLTEEEAREQEIAVKVTRFPWAVSGRSLTLGRTDGLTKIVFEEQTGRILGMGIVGSGAGELIAEGTLAVEMAAVAEDVALTIHTHPTLSETVGEAAELFLGSAIHIHKK